MAYLAFSPPAPGAPRGEGVRRGLAGVAFVFLMYCALQLRDTSLRRPHPVVWRIFQGMAILYLLAVTFVLMQTPDEARQLLRVLDPALGVIPEENFKSYASDCRIYASDKADPWENIRDSLDAFVIAHALGWVCKALIVRDWALIWVWSLSWELLEISLQHVLPNFKECWYDHWLLDVLGCNLAGAALGMALCKYFEGASYNWTGMQSTDGVRGKAMRVIQQFTPFSWTTYEWRVFSSPMRLAQVIFALLLMNGAELTCFYMKFNLWIKPSHPIVVTRLLLLGFFMMPTFREYYDYMMTIEEEEDARKGNKRTSTWVGLRRRRMGPNCWLGIAIVVVEALIVIKFWRLDPGQYNALAKYNPEAAARPNVPAPRTVARCWAVAIAAFLVWSAAFFGTGGASPRKPRTRAGALALDALLALSAAPLLLLYALDFCDTFAL